MTEKRIYGLTGTDKEYNWDKVFSVFYHAGRGEIYPNELNFWRSICAGKENVLEVGAGTGFVAAALIDQGIKNLTLVEPEPANLQFLEKLVGQNGGNTNIVVFPGIFQGYAPSDRMLQDVIYMTWDNLVMFVEPGARQELFRNVADNLKPGGVFAFHISSLDWNKRVGEKLKIPKEFDMELEGYGKVRIAYQIDTVRENFYNKHIKIKLPEDMGGQRDYLLPTEAVPLAEVMRYAGENDLSLVNHWRDYSGTPVGDDPDDHVFVFRSAKV